MGRRKVIDDRKAYMRDYMRKRRRESRWPAKRSAKISVGRKIDYKPLFDPLKMQWPEIDLAAQLLNDPPPGRREMIERMREEVYYRTY